MDSNSQKSMGRVVRISGPLVIAEDLPTARMYDVVRVGDQRLFGEIIEIHGNKYSIQVYEETEGLRPGAPVEPTGMPLTVELGPGLISTIYDGLQRPLEALRAEQGDYILRGAELPALDPRKKWRFEPTAEAGADVQPGDIIGTVAETQVVQQRILVPQGVTGKLVHIAAGEYTVDEVVAKVQTQDGEVDVRLAHRWPVRQPRPVARRLAPNRPLVTGQRVIDMFFPVTKGGTACIPGPFGSGKTVVQHQLAKWTDADIIIYVGCGERGNEMTDVLLEFPELKDPRTGRPLMERTVLVANTSNMPVAAREASVFTGITIAEYFRDMGYAVALMADSTSRWAEAMREISGRLEEMPGEEGYPAYLPSRIASFYERGGRVQCLGKDPREATLSIIGAVSPPGGDLSDPVVQATLRVVKVFWALDDRLAAQRHFPAINWLMSYSQYQGTVDDFAGREVDIGWHDLRQDAMATLTRESELEELVRLVGIEALSPPDRLLMQVAKMIREDFLHQYAFDPQDTYTSMKKQFRMLKLIAIYETLARKALDAGAELGKITSIEALELVSRSKLIPEDQMHQFDDIEKQLNEQFAAITPLKETSDA